MIRQLIVSSCLLVSVTQLTINNTASAASTAISIPQELNNQVLGVKLDDLVAYQPKLIAGLPNVILHLKKYPKSFFNMDDIQVVHTVFLNQYPEMKNNEMILNLTAFVKYKRESVFEKFTIKYINNGKKMEDLTILPIDRIALSETMFNLTVGLVERKLIIEDMINSIKMVLPIGVGSFDEGVMNEGRYSLITPRFKKGFLDKRVVISKREKPRYFAGKPFIRLLKGDSVKEDSTPIGFHIEINGTFVRGFDSHGCMRLRAGDLQSLHDLIMDGDKQQLPITVSYRTEDEADHPAPKRNKLFKTIQNIGTKESPYFILDRDNLVQVIYKETKAGAPIDLLTDDSRDHYEDFFNYETVVQLREQEARRTNECQAKVMAGLIGSSDSDLKKCIDAGKREDTLKDRLYRKYMGLDSDSGYESSLI